MMTTGAYSPYWRIWITAASEGEPGEDEGEVAGGVVEYHSNPIS